MYRNAEVRHDGDTSNANSYCSRNNAIFSPKINRIVSTFACLKKIFLHRISSRNYFYSQVALTNKLNCRNYTTVYEC